jgi:hypothetical protein
MHVSPVSSYFSVWAPDVSSAPILEHPQPMFFS